MLEIKYYPLIDCEDDGSEKMPMFPSTDGKSIRAQSQLWLEELVPHYYSLHGEQADNSTNAFCIRCPLCGKPLQCISGNSNKNNLGLYVCSSCVKP